MEKDSKSDREPCPNCEHFEQQVYMLEQEIIGLKQQIAELKRKENPTQPSSETPGPPKDRLAESLSKLEQDKERRKTLFEKASSDLQKKKADADKLFKENIDQINKDGGKVTKDIRPIDLD